MNLKQNKDELDNIYNLAKSGGALGGKLLGAGGGGFFLFIVPENKQEIVRKLLSNLVEVNFKFEKIGAKIINV